MKLSSIHVAQSIATTQTAPTQAVPTQSGVGGSGSVAQSPMQSPTQGSPAPQPAPQGVPRGQLDRTRDKLPQGWFNDGGHKGFKPAVISQVADGYLLTAVNPSDVPRGRRR